VATTASVVIPSIRGNEALVALSERLLAGAVPTEVVVADNGLPTQTVASLRSAGARIVEMGGNLGFGAAVNRAARTVEGNLLVLLNDDAMPLDGFDFVGELAAQLREGADMVAGVLVQADRPDLIDTAGIELDSALNPLDYLRDCSVERLEGPVPPPIAPSGGAVAYRMNAFVEARGFDEGFFAYWEDLDLGLRLRAAGARCALALDARAAHSGSATLGDYSLDKSRIVGFSRGYFLRKWGALRRPSVALRVLPVEVVSCLILARRHRSFAPAVARVRGWRNCHTRADWPADAQPTVDLLTGMRRRHARRTPRPGAPPQREGPSPAEPRR
jgi:GT2 family glycosyltransferase